MRMIYVGARRIVSDGPDRFKINLPRAMNRLWEELRGRKVEVYIAVEVDEDERA